MSIKKSFRKKAGVFLGLIIVVLVAIQFIRPPLDNPPVLADLTAPAAVKEIIKRACYDCHSNETKLAWFDQPAPAYWLVADHVKDGRKVLNFSLWDSLSKDQQAGKLYESLNQIEFGVMPVKQYAWLHHGARITPDEIKVLREYLYTIAPVLLPDPAKARMADAQYAKWIEAPNAREGIQAPPRVGTSSDVVLPVPNGIAYIPGFRDWTAISTTERFDNGTMRVIFGNAVAVSAIREGRIHPWPDGAIFAKVAWDQLVDSAGEVYPGAFKQVEFMIRDNNKYSATDGWGWGRWRGMQLTPYGKTAGFTTECVNCHKPMQDYDHVFTMPIADTLNLYDQAFRPLTGKVISSFIDRKGRTMSTLYGNDIAAVSARSGNPSYPAGSVLTLVTWSQRDDAHWFGARIPEAVRSVEQITFGPGARAAAGTGDAVVRGDAAMSGSVRPSYEKFEGMPLQKKTERDQAIIQSRIIYITTRKAAVMP